MSEENAVLAAIADLKRHQVEQGTIFLGKFREQDIKLDGVVERVVALETRVGSPTDPPTAVLARQAVTSSHDLDNRTKTLDERIDALEGKVDKTTEIMERIERAIVGPVGSWFRSIFATAAVRTAVTGLVLAALAGGSAFVGRCTVPASASSEAGAPVPTPPPVTVFFVLPEGGVQ